MRRGYLRDKVVRRSQPFCPIRDWPKGYWMVTDNVVTIENFYLSFYRKISEMHGEILPSAARMVTYSIRSRRDKNNLAGNWIPTRDNENNRVMDWGRTLSFLRFISPIKLYEEYVILRLASGGLALVHSRADPIVGDLIVGMGDCHIFYLVRELRNSLEHTIQDKACVQVDEDADLDSDGLIPSKILMTVYPVFAEKETGYRNVESHHFLFL